MIDISRKLFWMKQNPAYAEGIPSEQVWYVIFLETYSPTYWTFSQLLFHIEQQAYCLWGSLVYRSQTKNIHLQKQLFLSGFSHSIFSWCSLFRIEYFFFCRTLSYRIP